MIKEKYLNFINRLDKIIRWIFSKETFIMMEQNQEHRFASLITLS